MFKLSLALLVGLFAALTVQARETVSQEVNGAEIVACADALLASRGTGLEGKLEWAPVGPVSPSQIPAGRYQLRAGDIAGTWPRSRVGVPVQVWMDDRMVQSRLVWFSVRWWKNALVYARAANTGETARPELVQIQLIDAIGSRTLASAETQWMEGMRLRHQVRAGKPVLKGDFEPAPIVARDEKVQVQVRIGGVRLSTTGIATQQGGLDEEISVRPDGSLHSVKARVVAKNEVRIER
jgi:flagellar basal body P-ring formation protein FlgA